MMLCFAILTPLLLFLDHRSGPAVPDSWFSAAARPVAKKLAGGGIREKRQVARPLDFAGQPALVVRTDSGEAARDELAIVSQEPFQEVRILVVERLSKPWIRFKRTVFFSSETSFGHSPSSLFHAELPLPGHSPVAKTLIILRMGLRIKLLKIED